MDLWCGDYMQPSAWPGCLQEQVLFSVCSAVVWYVVVIGHIGRRFKCLYLFSVIFLAPKTLHNLKRWSSPRVLCGFSIFLADMTAFNHLKQFRVFYSVLRSVLMLFSQTFSLEQSCSLILSPCFDPFFGLFVTSFIYFFPLSVSHPPTHTPIFPLSLIYVSSLVVEGLPALLERSVRSWGLFKLDVSCVGRVSNRELSSATVALPTLEMSYVNTIHFIPPWEEIVIDMLWKRGKVSLTQWWETGLRTENRARTPVPAPFCFLFFLSRFLKLCYVLCYFFSSLLLTHLQFLSDTGSFSKHWL